MKSMTGFGRAEATDQKTAVSVEVTSVNRKQSEVSISLPRHLGSLEGALRKLVLSQISRGRVSVQFSIQESNDGDGGVRLDHAKVAHIEREFSALSEALGRPLSVTPTDILAIPGVLVTEAATPEEVFPLLRDSLQEAMKKLVEMRALEGDDLHKDCKLRLQSAENILGRVSERAPIVLSHYRTQLISKLQEIKLGGEDWSEDDRIIKEIALFADRSDITEEITRFRSHLDKFYQYLAMDEPVGRSLDFLCQELNRELNTIGAKANDALLAQLVVEGKTEIEKIREQIQNIE